MRYTCAAVKNAEHVSAATAALLASSPDSLHSLVARKMELGRSKKAVELLRSQKDSARISPSTHMFALSAYAAQGDAAGVASTWRVLSAAANSPVPHAQRHAYLQALIDTNSSNEIASILESLESDGEHRAAPTHCLHSLIPLSRSPRCIAVAVFRGCKLACQVLHAGWPLVEGAAPLGTV